MAAVYDTPRGKRIYGWLRREPPLSKVVGIDDADQEVTVALTVPKPGMRNPPKWKDAIGALWDCTKLRGLNGEGEVVRVLNLDPNADPVLADATERREVDLAARRDAKEHGSTLIAVDVPKLVDNIARNMKEVAEASALQQSNAFSAGFKAMTDVVQLCIGLLGRVDARLEQLEQQQPPEPEPEPEPDTRSQNAALLLQALQGQQGQQASGGAVNPEQAAQLAALLQQYLGGNPPTAEGPNGHAQ